jgi:hypothetical protein
VASIYAVVPRNTTRRLSFAENADFTQYFEDDRRRAEEASNATTTNNTGLRIQVIDCLFSDNFLGASPGAETTAIIYSVGASMEMSDSVIVGTMRDELTSENVSNLVYLESASMVMQDNCFIGNHESIAPVVAVSSMVQANSNFNQRMTSELSSTQCEFIAHGDFDSGGYTCKNSDASVCTAAKPSSQYRFPCINYLDDIYFSEWDVTNTSLPRTYILCHDTVFRVGSRHDEDGTPLGGSYPIILGRSNVRVLCGVDGSIDNGCEVVNGVVQVAHFDEFNTGGWPIYNCLVSGVSFAGASAINALVSGTGKVTFQDCLFRDNSNVGIAYVQLLPRGYGATRRNLQSTLQSLDFLSGKASSGRQLSTHIAADVGDLVARFVGCVFVVRIIRLSNFHSVF